VWVGWVWVVLAFAAKANGFFVFFTPLLMRKMGHVPAANNVM
jgi:hypothetical protein